MTSISSPSPSLGSLLKSAANKAEKNGIRSNLVKNDGFYELSLRIPKSETTRKKGGADPLTKEVIDPISTIKERLAELNSTKDIDTTKARSVLYLDPNNSVNSVNSVNVECMLHFISADPNFLPESRSQCEKTLFDPKYASNGKLSLKKLIALSGNFDSDKKLYDNLYEFVISMTNFVANDDRFKLAPEQTQLNIIQGVRSFIIEDISYSSAYINRYKIINDPIIKNSYNLLLLLNSFTYKYANAGKSHTELIDLHNQLEKSIEENIALYNQLPVTPPETGTGVSPSPINNETAQLVKQLKNKLQELKIQKQTLEINVRKINLNKEELKTIVDDKNILELANKLEKI